MVATAPIRMAAAASTGVTSAHLDMQVTRKYSRVPSQVVDVLLGLEV